MGISYLDKLKDKKKVTVLKERIEFQNKTVVNQKKQITEYKTENAQLEEQLEKFSKSIQYQTGIIAEHQRDSEEMLLVPIDKKLEPSRLVMKGVAQIEALCTVIQST